ncbi:hypothetical protein [Gordonia malaquae]|uniref:hypothetical protein n=1 Tax=Gordonia malaquae TaxID=410332 RepID=UPI0030FE9F87
MSEIVVHCHDQFEWFENDWDTCPGCGVSRRDWDRQHVDPLTIVTKTTPCAHRSARPRQGAPA